MATSTIPQLAEQTAPNADYLIPADSGSQTYKLTLATIGRFLGMPPVGAILPYMPGYFANGSNGTFTLSGPATNDAAGINAYLPDNWRVCNGAELNDAASPIFNVAGRYLPNLTDSRFLIGSTAAGAIGGASSVTLAEANLPAHTHSINHDHAAQTSLGNSADHSHTINHDHAAQTSLGNSVGHTHQVPGLKYATQSYGFTPTGSALRWSDTYNPGSGTIATTDGNSASHTHSVDLPSFSGSSGNNSVDHTHSVDLPSFTGTSGSTGSGSSFSILPTYLATVYIMRVK